MTGAFRRIRAYGGHFALLAALVMIAAVLLTAMPRIANRLSDGDLRSDLAGLPWNARDVVYQTTPSSDRLGGGVVVGSGELDRLQAALPPEVRRLIGDRWYSANADGWLGPADTRAVSPINFQLRAVSGAQEAVRVVDGRWPQPQRNNDAVEMVVSSATAEALGIRVGSRWVMIPPDDAGPLLLDNATFELIVVGVFEPVNASDEIWEPSPLVAEPLPPLQDGDPWDVAALTGEDSFTGLAATGWPVKESWRFRTVPERLTADQVQPTLQALLKSSRTLPPGLTIVTGLDNQLEAFADSVRTVRALAAVVIAGVFAALVGLIMLAVRLAGDNRRAEFGLLRARGGSNIAVAGRSLAESALVVPVGALVGWAVGIAVPGRAASTGWLVVLAATGTALALPLAAVLHRSSGMRRQDVVSVKPSLRRRTAEVSVLVLAALAVYLLHQRGLPADGTVDPFLVSTPVLLAIAAAVLAVRIYPWPLRLIGRVAARTRGAVLFLGAARAGRAAAATVPIIVLVVATATAAFCAVVARGIGDAREKAAAHAIPADALLTAEGFAADTADELAAVPGVRAVASMTRVQVPWLATADGTKLGQSAVQVLVIDGPALARVVAESGAQVELPTALTDTADRSEPLPALVSPEVGDDVPDTAFVLIQGRQYEFRVAAVVDAFPTLALDSRRFVVLPRQALPEAADAVMVPTGFLIAASGVDPAVLRTVGDNGQRRWLTAGPTPREPVRDSTVSLRADYRAQLDRGGHSGLLSFIFVTGSVGGAVSGLLAVAFVVLSGARSRGRLLSRLRTLGLSVGQWRVLLSYELAPVVGVALLTGALVGVLLPVALAPVLQLSTITGGMPVPARIDPAISGVVVLLGALAVGTAIVVETMINRRLRLGEVLRLGEEN